jgi:hypothetical protein
VSPRAGLEVFAFTGIRTPDRPVRGLVPILIVTPAPDKEHVRRILKYLTVSGLTCVVREFCLRKFITLNPVRLARFGFRSEHLPVCKCQL